MTGALKKELARLPVSHCVMNIVASSLHGCSSLMRISNLRRISSAQRW